MFKDSRTEKARDCSRGEFEGEGADRPGAIFGDAAGAAVGAVWGPGWKFVQADTGRTRLWAAATAAGVAGAAAAAVASAATSDGMATARGARPEADATRATTTESFPGPGTAEGGWKREGEDGRDLLYTDTVQLWQGRGCVGSKVSSEPEGGLGAIAGADDAGMS